MVWTCEAMCKGSHGGRLARQCVRLARELVNRGWSMRIAHGYRLLNSGRDLQEQCHKSYVASYSYRANEELVISRMFLTIYVNEGDSQKSSSVNDSHYTVL